MLAAASQAATTASCRPPGVHDGEAEGPVVGAGPTAGALGTPAPPHMLAFLLLCSAIAVATSDLGGVGGAARGS